MYAYVLVLCIFEQETSSHMKINKNFKDTNFWKGEKEKT